MCSIDSVQSYLDGYISFLKDHSQQVRIDDNLWKITLPFLDNLHDCTEIYIQKNIDGYLLTDNGETISNLEFTGVVIKGVARERIFHQIISSYGVFLRGESLCITANEQDLFLKKHLLLQCVGKVNDMYMLNRSNVQNIFVEEVKGFFDKNNVWYVPNHRLTGKSGLIANYDFAIPKHKNSPFTLIKTLNKVAKDKVKATVFDWNDTKDNCGDANPRLFVVYNDEEIPKEDTLSAFQMYGIDKFSWSKKEDLLKILAAS